MCGKAQHDGNPLAGLKLMLFLPFVDQSNLVVPKCCSLEWHFPIDNNLLHCEDSGSCNKIGDDGNKMT